jgi:hypothetical protein
MVTLPMDAFFQPLFYTFEGLLDDIYDRLQSPNKIFGTWGSKKGPAATECMKGLGHLKVALELRPALYKADRMMVFQEQLAKKPEFDATAAALLTALGGVTLNTPTLVGDSPSYQVYFVRNVLAFLDAMETFPACQRGTAERVANFFTNNASEIAKYKGDLQAYLDSYNKRYGRLFQQAVATNVEVAKVMAAATTAGAKAMPLPSGQPAIVGPVVQSAVQKATNAATVAAMKRYGQQIAGGRRRTHRRHRKDHRRHRKSRRHH